MGVGAGGGIVTKIGAMQSPEFQPSSFPSKTTSRRLFDEEMGSVIGANGRARFSWKQLRGNCGLGLAAFAYVSIDYLRYLAPTWHERLQPALWIALALAAVSRIPFYLNWAMELRAAIPFLASIIFMLSAFLFEALSVRFSTAVLGLDWHK